MKNIFNAYTPKTQKQAESLAETVAQLMSVITTTVVIKVYARGSSWFGKLRIYRYNAVEYLVEDINLQGVPYLLAKHTLADELDFIFPDRRKEKMP